MHYLCLIYVLRTSNYLSNVPLMSKHGNWAPLLMMLAANTSVDRKSPGTSTYCHKTTLTRASAWQEGPHFSYLSISPLQLKISRSILDAKECFLHVLGVVCIYPDRDADCARATVQRCVTSQKAKPPPPPTLPAISRIAPEARRVTLHRAPRRTHLRCHCGHASPASIFKPLRITSATSAVASSLSIRAQILLKARLLAHFIRAASQGSGIKLGNLSSWDGGK